MGKKKCFRWVIERKKFRKEDAYFVVAFYFCVAYLFGILPNVEWYLRILWSIIIILLAVLITYFVSKKRAYYKEIK